MYLLKHRTGEPISLAKNQIANNMIEFEVRKLSKGDVLEGNTGPRELGLVIFGGPVPGYRRRRCLRRPGRQKKRVRG